MYTGIIEIIGKDLIATDFGFSKKLKWEEIEWRVWSEDMGEDLNEDLPEYQLSECECLSFYINF